MLGNDISNRTAPIIAFNMDSLLYKKGDYSFLQKLFKKKEINQNFIDIVNNIWYKYEFSIYFLTESSIEDAESRLMDIVDVQVTRVAHYTGIDNLRRLINYRFHLYVDCDKTRLSILSCNNAIHIDDLYKYLKVSRGD